MKIQNRAQKGFSLIELLLVLAIIAAIGVAAFIIYPRVQAGRAASSNATILSSAQAATAALFPSSVYNKLSTEMAYASDIFPENMKGAAATDGFTNEWDGAVTIIGSGPAGTALTGAPNRYMTIGYAGVPKNVCVKLATAAAANFGRVAIDGNVVVDQYDTSTTNDVIDEAAVTTNCGNAATADMLFTAR